MNLKLFSALKMNKKRTHPIGTQTEADDAGRGCMPRYCSAGLETRLAKAVM